MLMQIDKNKVRRLNRFIDKNGIPVSLLIDYSYDCVKRRMGTFIADLAIDNAAQMAREIKQFESLESIDEKYDFINGVKPEVESAAKKIIKLLIKHERENYAGIKKDIECNFNSATKTFVCSHEMSHIGKKHKTIKCKNNRLYGIEGLGLEVVGLLIDFYESRGV